MLGRSMDRGTSSAECEVKRTIRHDLWDKEHALCCIEHGLWATEHLLHTKEHVQCVRRSCLTVRGACSMHHTMRSMVQNEMICGVPMHGPRRDSLAFNSNAMVIWRRRGGPDFSKFSILKVRSRPPTRIMTNPRTRVGSFRLNKNLELEFGPNSRQNHKNCILFLVLTFGFVDVHI